MNFSILSINLTNEPYLEQIRNPRTGRSLTVVMAQAEAVLSIDNQIYNTHYTIKTSANMLKWGLGFDYNKQMDENIQQLLEAQYYTDSERKAHTLIFSDNQWINDWFFNLVVVQDLLFKNIIGAQPLPIEGKKETWLDTKKWLDDYSDANAEDIRKFTSSHDSDSMFLYFEQTGDLLEFNAYKQYYEVTKFIESTDYAIIQAIQGILVRKPNGSYKDIARYGIRTGIRAKARLDDRNVYVMGVSSTMPVFNGIVLDYAVALANSDVDLMNNAKGIPFIFDTTQNALAWIEQQGSYNVDWQIMKAENR